MAREQRGIGDQLKEHFRAGKDEPVNRTHEDINKSLEKEFGEWMKADDEGAAKDVRIGSSLRRNKERYSPAEKVEKPRQAPAQGVLQGMESRRIYEQLSMKQKKEIAWLLREEGLV